MKRQISEHLSNFCKLFFMTMFSFLFFIAIIEDKNSDFILKDKYLNSTRFKKNPLLKFNISKHYFNKFKTLNFVLRYFNILLV